MIELSKSIVFFVVSVACVFGDFNPFMDADLFKVTWPGQAKLDMDMEAIDQSRIVVMTSNKEKYKCILPESADNKDGSKGDYSGQTADELMNVLFTQSSCSYRIESYWTYELCHGKHLRQYHETKEVGMKPKVQEYFLGYGKQEEEKKDDDTDGTVSSHVKIRKIEGISLPYFEVNMTDGTTCDLTQTPRKTRILYVCQPDGHGEIYEFKEMSTCEYEVMVLTSVLCGHPDFRPKNPPVSEIECHSMDGSPDKPTSLRKMERDVHQTTQVRHKQATPPKASPTPAPAPTGSKLPSQFSETQTLGTTTDRQMLREFLTGDHCLKGGQGWWKHEFCYGKVARQVHDDSEGRIIINLGFWDEAKHLQWLKKYPHKRPKELGKRKYISLFYTGGDTCDLTGKPREVEVKLKCVANTAHPHSVSIYLMEPSTCSYILGIESPIFCSLLEKADSNGVLKNIEL